MTDKTLAERLRDETPATQSFQHSLLGDLLHEAADALDAKDAENARLRKTAESIFLRLLDVIEKNRVMTDDEHEAVEIVRTALRK